MPLLSVIRSVNVTCPCCGGNAMPLAKKGGVGVHLQLCDECGRAVLASRPATLIAWGVPMGLSLAIGMTLSTMYGQVGVLILAFAVGMELQKRYVPLVECD